MMGERTAMASTWRAVLRSWVALALACSGCADSLRPLEPRETGELAESPDDTADQAAALRPRLVTWALRDALGFLRGRDMLTLEGTGLTAAGPCLLDGSYAATGDILGEGDCLTGTAVEEADLTFAFAACEHPIDYLAGETEVSAAVTFDGDLDVLWSYFWQQDCTAAHSGRATWTSSAVELSGMDGYGPFDLGPCAVELNYAFVDDGREVTGWVCGTRVDEQW